MDTLCFLVLPVCLELIFAPLAGAIGGMFGDSSTSFSYSWSTGPWGPCNGNQCGFAGSQTRHVWCTHPVLGTQPPSKCDQVTMPESRRNCFKVCEEHRHLFAWLAGDWEKCQRTVDTGPLECGETSLGMKSRAVKCVDTSTGFLKEETREVVPQYICEQFEIKPPTEMECFTPCPQNCIVGAFSKWSECTSTCGNGTQTRTREVVVPPIHSGRSCPNLSETRMCKNNPPCESNEFTYFTKVGTWMKCQPPARGTGNNRLPGIGLQLRTVSCLKNNGEKVDDGLCYQYENENSLVPSKFQSCLVPRDCATTSWSTWSTCPNPCKSRPDPESGTVYKERKRSVTVAPLGGGTLCPKLVERLACPASDEPRRLECPTYVWHSTEWSDCSVDAVLSPYEKLHFGNDEPLCGGGMHQRDVFCTMLNDTGTDLAPVSPSLCNPNTKPELISPCEVPCPSTCQVTPWSQWSDCISEQCSPENNKKLKGHKIRTREVAVEAEDGGEDCPHLTEYVPCDIAICFKWHAVDSGECIPADSTARCGQGEQELNITCLDMNQNVVDEDLCSSISPKPETQVQCWVPCPNDCVVGEWGAWSPCSMVCGKGGVQTRYKNIRAYPGPGGYECPMPQHLIETRACNDHSCAHFAWRTEKWSECISGLRPVQLEGVEGMCEVGRQTRTMECYRTLQDKVAPEKRCGEQGKPASVRECYIPCPQDCRVSSFGEWSACPQSCETGMGFLHERDRFVLQPVRHGGQPCPQLQERQVCPVPDSCYSYQWVPSLWSDCQLPLGRQRGSWDPCGDGLKTREVQCQREGGMPVDVDLCLRYGPPMPAAAEKCRILCEGECELTEWPRWSVCTDNCNGRRNRKRRLIGQSRRTPECDNPEIYPLIEYQPCRCHTYTLEPMGVWSNCFIEPSQFKVSPEAGGLMGDSAGGVSGGCGLGVKYRAVMCLDEERRIVDVGKCGAETDFTVEMCDILCPEDCELSPWSSWSECSETLNVGQRVRWREILQEGSEVGRPCPIPDRGNRMYQRMPCRSDAHSRLLWYTGTWHECEMPLNGSCGDGHQRREVRCKIDGPPGFYGPDNSSSLCDHRFRPPMTRSCSKPCPGECAVSDWSEWAPCPQDCENVSFHTRTRVVLRRPTSSTEGSITCPPLTQVEPCNMGDSCVTYRWNATDWGSCVMEPRGACGTGKKIRLLQCLQSNGLEVENSICDKLDLPKPETLEASCHVECPGDCILSPWTEWGKCTQACGHSVGRTRSRTVLRSANSLGRPCASSLYQWRPCKPSPCYRWVTGPWGHCLPRGGDCGIGWRQRNVTCQQEDGVLVSEELCQTGIYQSNINVTELGRERLEREQPCNIPCPSECQHTQWNTWSDCYVSCLQGRTVGNEGIQVRSRAALGPDSGCPTDQLEIRPCSGETCYEFLWQTGPWRKGKREVWCQRSGGLNVTGPCLMDMKPSTMVICEPDCTVMHSFCSEDNMCLCKLGYAAKFSETTGELIECTDEWIMIQDGDGEHRTPDQTVGSNQPNQAATTENNTVAKGKEGDAESKGFFESIPPWGYAIVGCVGLLILVIIIVVAIVYGCRNAKRKEEEKRKYQHAADYSIYWDDNAKKKYNGEVDL
ncbi:thrombospondin type-1 domain-containing protein 7A-like [Patiria miniata]|uniref:Spondin-like TSP1 domain-containing protein n=1 Tax=Patiria miniata TaxID=46514 RepID=A0A913Z4I3_PATMI|nr:thrombospondin type-1 domain-containing protein 7A-like [Patiria miniata]XP_038045645.1 thrombospondin type-1 domain-containing protein 7A-like [Patiria miniata]